MRTHYEERMSDPFIHKGYRVSLDGEELLIADVHNINSPVGITGRNIWEYDQAGFPAKDILNGKYGRDLRILEVGAGLSEFIAKFASKTSARPVICDPIDYNELQTLLILAKDKLHLQGKAENERKMLLERAEILGSSRNVTHIQFPIHQSIPIVQIGSGFDTVIDMYASSVYDTSVSSGKLESLLRKPPRQGKEAITKLFSI